VEPLLEILDVAQADAGDRLVGLALEPRLDPEPTFALNVGGWALGPAGPLASVSFVHDAEALWEIPVGVERPDVAEAHPDIDGADHAGFYATLNSLALPRQFELRVIADDLELGTIRGRRAPLPGRPEPGIRPLMLTGFSRTGSNLVLRLLGSHPEVVAYRPFQYEPRVLTYWVDVFRELTEPAAYLRQITTQGRIAARGWWLGTGGPAPRPIFDPQIQRSLALDTVEDAAAFCRRRIARVYARIASATDRPAAALFAEKQLPGAVPTIAWELYPDAREVFLVRDFRDMIASVLAWKARFGGPWFGYAAAKSDEEFVRSFERFATNLVASRRRRSEQAHTVRYEDLVGDPERTVDALVAYLGVEHSSALVERMVATLGEHSPESEAYRTTESIQASIGRWRNDLPAELQRAAQETFAPALEEFGYL
jgi:sulfotransferase family protein